MAERIESVGGALRDSSIMATTKNAARIDVTEHG